MTDPLSPALTKEAWSALRARLVVEWPHGYTLYVDDTWDVVAGNSGVALPGIRDGYRHALAALCLYGQPFGFTQEDVEMLRAKASEERQIAAWCPDGYSKGIVDLVGDQSHRSNAAALEALADRIQSLLPPPEEPQHG